jgi:hypothetical protein
MGHSGILEPQALTTDWYEGGAGVRQLRADWYELTPDAQLFARYEWHLAAAAHLVGDDHRIWFCRIGDNAGRPLAIIPAVTAITSIKLLGQLRALTLGWDTQLVALDFPLARGADAREVAKAMLEAFTHLEYDWRAITWPRVMADSNAAKIAMALNHWLTDITPSSLCSTFYTGNNPNPAGGYEVFTIGSPKLRRTLAQHARRLCQHGAIQMRMAREEGDVEEFFNEFLRIESSGWKGDKGTRTAIAFVPAARAFYSSLLAQSNADFETDIALLYCGNRAVAGQFLIRTAHWEYVYKIGYDEAFAKCSPGQLLLQMEVERARASDDIERVSLVTGRDWMKKWEPIQEPTLEISIFRHMWRPLILRVGRFFLTQYKRARLSALVQRTLEIVRSGRNRSMQNSGPLVG